ncbi:MAG TPA: DUF2167 domain-containing protein [Ferruginibacter sp.]|nr:DUF2167 domain-containing protein [Ferruginibacter sp.]HPH90722.1 DUF2167 domain-containing protein [Ferruginibacter sp.]
MRKVPFLFFTLVFFSAVTFAKGNKDSAIIALENQLKFIDSVQSSMKYQTGTISLTGGFATLNVPPGFKYLNSDQSNYIITELWGNPAQEGVLGMLFPADGGPFADSSYAFVIKFDGSGYVKDDDADDINYDDMLKEMQQGEVEENKTRAAQGFATIHMVGWASKPYYDKTNKVLHWAKNLRFADAESNTLNYEVRILGRKGVLSMNAVASMNELDLVKKDIDKVLKIPAFTEGNMYKDFDSNTDNVAAWTIGGLVAGKVLLKVGFFAKFWKIIMLGLVAAGAGIKKLLGRKSSSEVS